MSNWQSMSTAPKNTLILVKKGSITGIAYLQDNFFDGVPIQAARAPFGGDNG